MTRQVIYNDNDFCECEHLKLIHGEKGCAYGRLMGKKITRCKCKRYWVKNDGEYWQKK